MRKHSESDPDYFSRIYREAKEKFNFSESSKREDFLEDLDSCESNREIIELIFTEDEILNNKFLGEVINE